MALAKAYSPLQGDQRDEARRLDREHGPIDLIQNRLCGIAHDEAGNAGAGHAVFHRLKLDQFG